jgi:hypothetical protein
MGLARLLDELGLLTQLEFLGIGYNPLEGVPESIGNLKRLRHIDYEGSQSPATREQWKRLKEGLTSLNNSDDDSEYIADVTIPNGSEVVASQPFVKTWRLRNTGKTTWGRGYALVHSGGPDFGGLGCDVTAAPGEEIDVTLDMVATDEGSQRSDWVLQNAQGESFGHEL